MTPKEKALNIFYKHLRGHSKLDYTVAKSHCVITIDEILNLEMIETKETLQTEFTTTRNYWQEVKQEIEKL